MSDSIYFYNPSLAASVLFTLLYALPAIYHIYLTLIAPTTKTSPRASYYIPIIIGCLIEIASYGVRIASVKQPSSIPLYAVSSSLVVIAPVFICASLYILIGRLIRFYQNSRDNDDNAEARNKIQPVKFGKVSSSWTPRLFVTSDILSLLLQASGSGIAGANDWQGEEKGIGMGILVAGLVLQLVTFSVFLVLVGWFDVRMKPGYGEDRSCGVRLVVNGIYIAGIFMMVRLIYRVVEFSMGIDTYAWNHEWLLYVLEATPILIALMVLGWYHPSRCIKTSLGRSG